MRNVSAYQIEYNQTGFVSVAVDGGWSDWKNPVPVTDCSVTCGSGTRNFRLSRTCDSPPPSNGGKRCAGRSTVTVTRTCNTNIACTGNASHATRRFDH